MCVIRKDHRQNSPFAVKTLRFLQFSTAVYHPSPRDDVDDDDVQLLSCDLRRILRPEGELAVDGSHQRTEAEDERRRGEFDATRVRQQTASGTTTTAAEEAEVRSRVRWDPLF